MLIFGLHSTPDDRPGWLIDLNPIYHLSPATKMKCSFLDYVQLLMISQAGRWTQTASATPIQPKKMKCSFLDYIQLLMISWIGQWTRMPSTTPLQPKTWNACFWITFNFWWSARLVDALKPHLPPLSSQKNEMLIFGLHSTADDRPGWLMDLNPIYHLSPATKMKCSFLDYIQLLMIGRAGQWTWALCATSLQPKKWNAHFWVTFNFWWLARLVDGLKPHLQPLYSQKKWNAHFWITFNFWWLLGLINWLKPHPPPLSTQKMKCPFLHYIQILMISQVGPWTRTASAMHLQPKKFNAHFWNMFNFWWSARLVDGLKPHLPPLSSQKMKSSFLEYVPLLMIGQAGRWTRTPSATPLQPKKLNAHSKIMFNFWRLAGLVDGLKPHLSPLSSQKNEMLVFGLPSTSDDWPGWSMHSNPICHPSPAIKMKCSFWITFNFDVQQAWSMDLNPICHPSSASTSLANHQKLKVIQKQAFHSFGWRGVTDGVWVHQPAQPIVRSWT